MQGDRDTDNAWINRSQANRGALTMSANSNELPPGHRSESVDIGQKKKRSKN